MQNLSDDNRSEVREEGGIVTESGSGGCGCSSCVKPRKELVIEWRHYDKAGQTCDRCSTTGKTLEEVVSDLREELALQGIEVTFIEKKLGEDELAQSNIILFNGIPLEELVAGAKVSENACPSCTSLIGTETLCRTVEYHGKTYEEIPEALIRKAAFQVL